MSEQDPAPHPLLRPPDTLALGETLDVADVLRDYLMKELRQNNRRRTTIRDIERHVATWLEWWGSLSYEKLPIATIDIRHLQFFREWLIDPKKRGVSVCSANRHVQTIKQVLGCAARNCLVKDVPKIQSLPHRSVAPKVYLTDEEIDKAWAAAAKAKWPKKDSAGRPLPYSPATGWRAAIVLWRIYGFRTQELIRMESRYDAICWKNIHPPGMTPNVAGSCECEYGWLSYIPQKQKRLKPDPLVNPLTRYSRAAIWSVRPDEPDPEKCVFDWSLSSTGFRAAWHQLMRDADIKPREASGLATYNPKHFRKTATTMINRHRGGMAEHIVGHGGDRSGQQAVAKSEISSRHYDNAEGAVLECLETLHMPSSFEELFSA